MVQVKGLFCHCFSLSMPQNSRRKPLVRRNKWDDRNFNGHILTWTASSSLKGQGNICSYNWDKKIKQENPSVLLWVVHKITQPQTRNENYESVAKSTLLDTRFILMGTNHCWNGLLQLQGCFWECRISLQHRGAWWKSSWWTPVLFNSPVLLCGFIIFPLSKLSLCRAAETFFVHFADKNHSSNSSLSLCHEGGITDKGWQVSKTPRMCLGRGSTPALRALCPSKPTLRAASYYTQAPLTPGCSWG